MRVKGYSDAWIGGLAIVLFSAALLIGPRPAGAQHVEVPPTWGGPLLERPRLTGDWGGVRDDLGKKGIVFDADLYMVPEAVLSGGKDTGAEFWGSAVYTLNADTGKLGLWPGGFFKLSAESSFGRTVAQDVGSLVPVDTGWLVPEFNQQTTGLENATLTQFLSPSFGLLAGKIFTLDSAAGEFAGNYRSQFMNTGLTVPLALALVPLSAFGGGAIYVPAPNVILTAMVLDPDGTVLSNDVGKAFNQGVMVIAAGKATIKPFGLIGHQSLTGMWSDKSRVSLIQDPSNLAVLLLTQRFPLLGNPGPILQALLDRVCGGPCPGAAPLNREDNTWAVTYGFDQYLWQPEGDPKHGIGVFFNFGASDGRANPIKYSYNLGIGANGFVPGRPNDSFGIGWARTEFSDNLLPFVRAHLPIGLDHEDAIEIYYRAALTPWLNITPDLQIVTPAITKNLVAGHALTNRDTAVILGLRAAVRF